MVGAEFVVQILFAGHVLGFFQITFARADAYPMAFDLKRCLPALGVAALLHFASTVQQNVGI